MGPRSRGFALQHRNVRIGPECPNRCSQNEEPGRNDERRLPGTESNQQAEHDRPRGNSDFARLHGPPFDHPAAHYAHAMKRSRAAQKGDNQIDRASVLEVRIQSPPAESLRTFSSHALRRMAHSTPKAPFPSLAELLPRLRDLLRCRRIRTTVEWCRKTTYVTQSTIFTACSVGYPDAGDENCHNDHQPVTTRGEVSQ